MTLDEQHLKQWIGRQERHCDLLVPAPLNGLAATLDRDDAAYVRGDTVPLLWHWLYFLPVARQSTVGSDGHPQRGGFLPPISLPRRMWAGGKLTFQGPLSVGCKVERTSSIIDIKHKNGRSGDLVFVKLLHELATAGAVQVCEEQDIVYRDPPQPDDTPPAPQAAPTDALWQQRVMPDPVLLFRYSALTFNGHRIHYDRRYALEQEGYAGLVVQGPLIATLLMNLLRDRHPQAHVRVFTFRAIRPLFDLQPFDLCGRFDSESSVRLWAQDAEGFLCMDAQAELA